MTFMWKGRYVHMSRKDHPKNVFLGQGHLFGPEGGQTDPTKNMENTSQHGCSCFLKAGKDFCLFGPFAGFDADVDSAKKTPTLSCIS